MIEMFWESEKLKGRKFTSIEIVDKKHFEKQLKTKNMVSIGHPGGLYVRNDPKRFDVEGFVDDDPEFGILNLLIVVDEEAIVKAGVQT